MQQNRKGCITYKISFFQGRKFFKKMAYVRIFYNNTYM